MWTRNPQTFDKNAAPCPECREPASGYGFSEQVPEFTPEGQKRFDANKTGKGWAPDSPQAKANPQVHIGRRRGVPPGLANDPQATCNPDGVPRLLLMTPAPYEILMTPEVQELVDRRWEEYGIDMKAAPHNGPSRRRIPSLVSRAMRRD